MHLELKNIYKLFQTNILFENLCFDFSHYGFYLLTGKSGSGKSTLLNILAGYEDIDEGERDVDNRVSMACIFQNYELIEELTIQENILMIQHIEELNIDILEQLDIRYLLDRYPRELSQGQKQRVGIARALHCQPQVIICDEPTESLDNENKERVLKLLKKLSNDHVVIVASHDIEFLQNDYDYHYELIHQKLVLKDQKHQHQEIDKRNQEKQVDDKQVTQVIHKIIHKSSLFQIIFMSILIFMQLTLFLVEARLFIEKEDRSVANRNSVYVQTYYQSSGSLDKYCKEKRPILEFSSVPIKNKLIKMNIYPQSIDDDISDCILQANEIIINQNVALILKDELGITDEELINYEIKLNYQLGQGEYTVPCQVKNVIEEEVGDLKQVYYSYDGINDLLKKREFSEEFLTQYDYLYENGVFFELQCGTQVKDSFQSLLENDDFSVYHSLFSQQQDNMGQKSLYEFLFTTIQGILALVTLIYIVYVTIKDTTRNLTSLSIIHAVGVPIEKVKYVYFKEKVRYLIVVIPIVAVGVIIMNSLLQQQIGLVIYGYTLLCYVLYSVILWIKITKLQQKEISIILKEGKDS